MARQTTIITPENIPLTLELAGLGTRFGALLLDMVIQLATTLVAGIIFAIAAGIASWGAGGGGGSIVIGVLTVAVFIIWFGYFIFFEALWNGQTPGKKAFGLRVMRDGGYPVNFFSVATRNLIRIADFVPMAYAMGALCVFFNLEYKRLGDMVAGTVVIKERMTDPTRAFQTGPVGSALAPQGSLPPTVKNPLDALNPPELGLLRRFALRRWEMTPDDSERLAYRLIVPLVARLNLMFLPGVAPRYADLASVLVREADQTEADRDAS